MLRPRPLYLTARGHALVFHARHQPRVDGGGYGRDRHAQIERVLSSPLARPFLLRLIEHEVNEWSPRLFVTDAKNVRGDFYEKRFQRAAIPFVENVCKLRRVELKAATKNVVSFGDQLHVA